MSDIAGLIAPRPLRMVHGVEDAIYPIAETRKAFAALQEIYSVAGKPGNVELFEGPEGHKYYHEGSWPFIKASFDRIR
ncbi:MAG: hypothetical protein EOO14_21010 [Chitinophagaceae bacterium]|nr:MAG: hypothetical protein EOO14_21010 [Chitinophagaceae bacterium]